MHRYLSQVVSLSINVKAKELENQPDKGYFIAT